MRRRHIPDRTFHRPGRATRPHQWRLASDKILQPNQVSRSRSATCARSIWQRVRGSNIGVQANIIGVDGSRTDVVTVTEMVKLRPDLTVGQITNPDHAQIGIPVEITALVSERNGDVGATADCVLSADGVEIDRANGIWIDANRSVSCMFRPIFSMVGGSI
jgi:hypothetical protein